MSRLIKLLRLVRILTFFCSSLDCLYVLYFTLARSKLDYASVVWNYVKTNANRLRCIQQKIAALGYNRSLHMSTTVIVKLYCLSNYMPLCPLRYTSLLCF
jgi:hypothetical protein